MCRWLVLYVVVYSEPLDTVGHGERKLGQFSKKFPEHLRHLSCNVCGNL